MRWLLVFLTASSLLAAGCGSPSTPALEHADAQRLIALSNRVASLHDACAQQREIAQLHATAQALVAAHRVPAALRSPLMNAVEALVADQPTCLPAAPPATTSPPAPPPPPPAPPAPKHHPKHPEPHHHHGHDHGHDHGHGHHHGGGGD